MNRGKWIWVDDGVLPDDYARFAETVNFNGGKAIMEISADTNYAVYINEQLAFFGQYPDYPQYKVSDVKDISSFMQNGVNNIRIDVYYCGADTSTYYRSTPGVCYEITDGRGNLLACSSEQTDCCHIANYRRGACRFVTVQLGYSFRYDSTAVCEPYHRAVIAKNQPAVIVRDWVKPQLKKRADYKVVLSTDNRIIIDFGKETVGYCDLDFISDAEQPITVSWGEWLRNGEVPRVIINRDFSFEYVAKKGGNRFVNPYLRLGARYLQFDFEKPITANYLGIMPYVLPLKVKDINLPDSELKAIYDSCVYTLECCMHDHYEDCPWREQAFYALDSRNQMLCGYYAYEDKNKDYVRASLKLQSHGVNKDGLLSICFPSSIDLSIPLFSLAYVLQVCEYVEYTGDSSLFFEVKQTLDGILDAFTGRIDHTGLIPMFDYPYWNFYEWTDGNANESDLGNKDREYQKGRYELIINCAYVMAMQAYAKIAKKSVNSTIIDVIRDVFYDKERGLFISSNINGTYSQIGNAFAVLCGAGGKEVASKIFCDPSLTKASISMKGFCYDALIKADKDCGEFILEDIKKTYRPMLEKGNGTVWETENGEKDFDGAGSLCHGWSAVPIVYIHKLLLV